MNIYERNHKNILYKYIINILTNQEEEENNHRILFDLTILSINFVYHNRCRGSRR